MKCKVEKTEVKLDTNQVSCPRLSGPCTVSASESLPCKHLFFVRHWNRESLLDSAMISKRWFKTMDDSEVLTKNAKRKNIFKNIESKPSKLKRFNAFNASDVKKKLQAFLSNCTEKEIEIKISQLDEILDLWENGLDITIEEEKITPFDFSQKKNSKNCTFYDFESKRINKKLKVSGLTVQSAQKRERKTLCGDKAAEKEKINVFYKNSLDEFIVWQQEHIDALNPLATGIQAWLSDVHFLVITGLLKMQFPELNALFPTTLYLGTGFPCINPSHDFIQPIHAGSDHWAVLTNIFVEKDQRHNTVILYDSMIRMENNSRTKCIISSAVFWQANQLLHSKGSNMSNITIRVHPCMQQSNAWDCGPFAIANCIMLAYGKDPQFVKYTGNLRSQIYNMTKQFSLQEITHEKVPGFTVDATISRIQKKIPMRVIVQCVSLLCDCQRPASWSNLVACSDCKKDFHQVCYLIGNDEVAKKIDFTCYTCRATLNPINFVESKVDAAVKKFEKLPGYKLGRYIPVVKNCNVQNRILPTILADYMEMHKILHEYNIICLAKGHGPLFDAFCNYYVNNIHETAFRNIDFHYLNIAEKIHLCLLLVNDIFSLNCNGVWEDAGNAVMDLTKSEKDILEETKGQVLSLEEKINRLHKKVVDFCKKSANKTYTECLDKYSSFKHEFETVDLEIETTRNQMQNCKGRVRNKFKKQYDELNELFCNCSCKFLDAKGLINSLQTEQKFL